MKNKKIKPGWDERYAQENFVYGTVPNDFLKENADHLPKGKVLCLAEGEGRNAVYLAQLGYAVTAVDSSKVGLEKAQKLARQQGVEIETLVADLTEFDLGTNQWDAIVSIFCHLPPPLRRDVHCRVVVALKKGGVLLAEAYTPRQLDFKTGGPPVRELLVEPDVLREELKGLQFIQLTETEREVHEGILHFGKGAVVQVIAIKK